MKHDKLAQTLHSEDAHTLNADTMQTYGFWEDGRLPTEQQYHEALRLYTRIGLGAEQFIKDYGTRGKRTLYLAEIDSSLEHRAQIPRKERDGFLRRIYPLARQHQGIYNAIVNAESNDVVTERYKEVRKQLAIERKDMHLANPCLISIGSPYVSNAREFVDEVVRQLGLARTQRGAPGEQDPISLAIADLETKLTRKGIPSPYDKRYESFVATLDQSVEMVKHRLPPDDDMAPIAISNDEFASENLPSDEITREELAGLLKEYARQSQVTNAFAKELSRQTGRPVLLWANQRGGIVATRAIDSPLAQLPAELRSAIEDRISRREQERGDLELATAIEYAHAMERGDMPWSVQMMEGKIPSSASHELRTFFNSIDHLNDYKRRIGPILAETRPILLFVDRSSSYRFPVAAQRFKGFMAEHFPAYAVTGVLAHNSEEINGHTAIWNKKAEAVMIPVDEELTGIPRHKGGLFRRLVSKGYFSRIRALVERQQQAIVLNPQRERYACERYGIDLSFDDDTPEFFGMHQSQTMGRELLMLTERGAEFLSEYKDRFIRDYSGWTRRNAQPHEK